ncbi:MAG: hypothetical protein SFV81_27160 [Pirellulaceae bacterium]|nr:hypothetical protein [Pirellulaceae bacterium]
MSRCRDITKLISDTTERDLTLWERIDLRTHLILCGFCRRFQANVRALRRLAAGQDSSLSMKLSNEAKARIREVVRQELG